MKDRKMMLFCLKNYGLYRRAMYAVWSEEERVLPYRTLDGRCCMA